METAKTRKLIGVMRRAVMIKGTSLQLMADERVLLEPQRFRGKVMAYHARPCAERAPWDEDDTILILPEHVEVI